MTQDRHTDDGPDPRENVRESLHHASTVAPTDSDRSPAVLTAWVVRYGDAPDELTLAPRDCPSEERLTTWMSAQAGSFVDLEDVR